ncbi:pentatricopeptide repeat-containing protein At1g08070, chloroplastic [Cryptomeria japonica]|uniref:pentatricopeptide repeat-containing protein At1g08070, chloroplastic n=1 Tax=Cryptomeria japonica TaxID=3369 RepID=UPI0027DA72E5|nr:pentatricopeptide repeat-containing protein At1g08070, chloroplastic [Cryptomeria japonica]
MRILFKSISGINKFNFLTMLSVLEGLLFRGKSQQNIKSSHISSTVRTQINSRSCEKQNVVSWTAMIGECVKQEKPKEALELYTQMQKEGTLSDSQNLIFPSVLKACAKLLALRFGKEIHGYIIRSGYESDFWVANSLVFMYAKCQNLEDARELFDKMSVKEMDSCVAVIVGYSQIGNCDESLGLLDQMQMAGLKFDLISWTTMISRFVHYGHDVEALKLFHRMQLSGYVHEGSCDLALRLLNQMQLSGLKPNSFTIASVLPACASSACLKYGKEIHQYILKNKVELNVFVETALVDMYAKCGNIEKAHIVFDKMLEKNAVSWNVMIAGYAQNGHGSDALKLFHEMQRAGIKPNSITMVSILPACAHMATLQQGIEIHNYIIQNGYSSNSLVGSALIDMYAKCGDIKDARRVFDEMPTRCVGFWNAMITAYALHGRGEDSLAIFNQMQHTALMPDHITFTGVLSACTHAGMVCEGMELFDCMNRVYHIAPRAEHYACVVDLLGRAGCLDEACGIINSMPFEPTASICGALLASCRTHCNVEIGELMADHLFKLEPENSGNYILLSSIYSATCRWDDAERVRKMMRDRGVRKKLGCSWIEIDKSMYTFSVGNESHPEMVCS